MTFEELEHWLEKNRQGFYGGCRVDEHSPQVNEFVAGLEYYLEVDFGYITKRRLEKRRRNATNVRRKIKRF